MFIVGFFVHLFSMPFRLFHFPALSSLRFFNFVVVSFRILSFGLLSWVLFRLVSFVFGVWSNGSDAWAPPETAQQICWALLIDTPNAQTLRPRVSLSAHVLMGGCRGFRVGV